MKFKAVMAVTALMLAAFIVVIPVDDSDAADNTISIVGGTKISISKGDSITLELKYTLDRNYSCTISVCDESGKEIMSQKVRFSAATDKTMKLDPFTYEGGGSVAHMYIELPDKDIFGKDKLYFDIQYTTSIWGNWGIYAAVIIVVVLIVIAVVWKSRSTPKDKNALTFEQIEAQRQAERASAPQNQKAPVKSERQRYLQSKKK